MVHSMINNRYKLVKTLAEGGFGKTFLTEDTRMPSRRYCVVKQLKPINHSPQIYKLVQDRFYREAVTLEELGNSNNRIPKLYEYFVENDQFYLVQEYIAGQTLTQKVQQYGVMSESAVKEILKSLLYLLNFVHSRQIIHRDIKPDNIILRDVDNVPVLIDFGAVRESMGTIANSQGQPTSSIIIGTPGFMPSEQAAGKPVYNSDLYSLALTMIYLLTGKIPQELQDPTTASIVWHKYAINVSPSLKMILDKALAYSPNERYLSATEMVDALKDSPENDTPKEIQVWNWGAFLLPGLWCFPNQVWIGLISWIPIVGLTIKFKLGAKGNTLAWKSRQWQNMEAFKSHQKAWTIAGLCVSPVWIPSMLLINFFTYQLIAGKYEDSSNQSQPEISTPSPNISNPDSPSPSTNTTDPSPETTDSPSPSTDITSPTDSPIPLTDTPSESLPVEINNLEKYTYKGGLFSIYVPEGWLKKDQSQPGEANVKWTAQNRNAFIDFDVIAADGETQDDLTNDLKKLVTKEFGSEPEFQIEQPEINGSTTTIDWTYQDKENSKLILSGKSVIEKIDNKVVIYIQLVPDDQFDKLEQSLDKIFESYKVDPDADLP